MPRIPDEIIRSVFFVFREGAPEPCGSGFLVRRPDKRFFGSGHVYGVSNIHVTNADKAPGSVIRLNTTNGQSRLLRLTPDDWKFIQNADDVSATELTDALAAPDEFDCIGEHEFLTEDALEISRIGPGDDAFMVGLYVNQPAGVRNDPNARFGNISRLASDDLPVLQGHGLRQPSHVVDMRSRTGFSGSPVFAYRSQTPNLQRLRAGHDGTHISLERRRDAFVGLLGIHSGQFQEEIIADGKPGMRERLYIPSSMTIVVPARKITELLDLQTFESVRKERQVRWEKEGKHPAFK